MVMSIENNPKRNDKDYVNVNDSLSKNNKKFDVRNEDQNSTDRNINLSLPIKDADSSVPFEKQLDASRSKREVRSVIIEKGMSDKIVNFGKIGDQVSAINQLAQKLYEEKAKKILSAEKKSRSDNKYWDIPNQMIGPVTKVPANVPEEGNGLFNADGSFKDKKIAESMRDADAMLFHIFASASQDGRGLTRDEQQQVTDINGHKVRMLSLANVGGVVLMGDPRIVRNPDGSYNVVEEDGEILETNISYEEAKSNYPEASIGDAPGF